MFLATPFYERFWEYCKNNRQRIIFFITVCALLNFMYGYRRINSYSWSRSNQFERVCKVLENENTIGDATKEMDVWRGGCNSSVAQRNIYGKSLILSWGSIFLLFYHQKVSLSPETITQLEELYLNLDKQLSLGVTRNLMVDLCQKIGALKTAEEVEEFYNQSQFLSSVIFQQQKLKLTSFSGKSRDIRCNTGSILEIGRENYKKFKEWNKRRRVRPGAKRKCTRCYKICKYSLVECLESPQ